MYQSTVTARTDLPPVEELVRRAHALAPMLRERAPAAEAARRVSGEVIAQLQDADLLGLCKPGRFGGLAYGPSVMVAVGSELAEACSATGWCAMLANCNNWFASYWPLEAQEDVWAGHERNLICGTVAPTGKAEAVDGGYNVWGAWPWASNSDNSQWAFVSAMVPTAEGPPTATWFLAPIEAPLTIDQDSWFVSGMQGTGSKTLVATEPFFVPEHRAIKVAEVLPRLAPGCRIDDNPLANFAFSTFGAVPLVSAVIGMAQGALGAFVAMIRDKVRVSLRPGGPVSAINDPVMQARVGQASTRIKSARTLLEQELARLEPKVFAGHAPTVDERLGVRAAIVFAAGECVEAVNSLMQVAGASSADSRLPLQRIWRDINAASRHVSFDAAATNTLVAQHLFGLEPKGNF